MCKIEHIHASPASLLRLPPPRKRLVREEKYACGRTLADYLRLPASASNSSNFPRSGIPAPRHQTLYSALVLGLPAPLERPKSARLSPPGAALAYIPAQLVVRLSLQIFDLL
jgi:hypothetical protein